MKFEKNDMKFVVKVSFLLMFSILSFPFTLDCASSSIHKSVRRRSTYIVHMDHTLKPSSLPSHRSWYHSILRSTSTTSRNQTYFPYLLYCYKNAAHGFSAMLSLDELEILKNSTGFISAYKDKVITLETTHTTEFLSLNHHTGLWPASNYGQNVIIGVIDTGIWPENDSFKDDGMTDAPSIWKTRCAKGQSFDASMCNSKLVGARYFKKGILAANPRIKISMNSARDIDGHGTQSSSIAAGNYVSGASYFGYALGKARGVAPKARIVMYKVAWPEGIYSSDILAGMDQALSDGVDLISISLSSEENEIYANEIAICSFAAMEKGVVVVTAAGNYGPSLGTLRNGFPWVLTIAASTVDRSFAGTITLGNGHIITGWTLFHPNTTIQDMPLIYGKPISLCNSQALLFGITNGVILCDRNKNVWDQINNITYASHIPAAIFISNDPKIFATANTALRGVAISLNDASIILNYARTTKQSARVSIRFHETILGVKPAPTAAYYSGRGPSPSIPHILKPDVMAPGSLILASSIPTSEIGQVGPNVKLTSQFEIVSGTSVACPHVSGVVALLKSVYPNWSPAAIRSAIMTTAKPLDNTFNPIKDNGLYSSPATPFSIGSGQVDPNKALDPGLIYDVTPQDYINLLCSMRYTQNQIASVIRSSQYRCFDDASIDFNYPLFMGFYDSGATSTTTTTFSRTLTNIVNGNATYYALLTAPKGTSARVMPQTLTFEKQYDRQTYTLTINISPNRMKRKVAHGELVWIERNGNHWVRSPVVVLLDYYQY